MGLVSDTTMKTIALYSVVAETLPILGNHNKQIAYGHCSDAREIGYSFLGMSY